MEAGEILNAYLFYLIAQFVKVKMYPVLLEHILSFSVDPGLKLVLLFVVKTQSIVYVEQMWNKQYVCNRETFEASILISKNLVL